MTDESKYTFLPSMRRGLSTRITHIGPRRGSIKVNLKLESNVHKKQEKEPKDIVKTVEIYGPGDVRGFDDRHARNTGQPSPDELMCFPDSRVSAAGAGAGAGQERPHRSLR